MQKEQNSLTKGSPVYVYLSHLFHSLYSMKTETVSFGLSNIAVNIL